ncbi:MAG: SMP-30/gluconolactonase/LRE family protein [Sphingorhabdus sp.]|nr:SMP-30/gluconolactonase/LRE family protein [Sphingorhabdus sp.]
MRDQSFWWVNCENPPELHRWHPESGAHDVWPMSQRIGGFVHKESGGLLLALADGIYDFDAETSAITLRAQSPLPPHVKLHECGCDRQGRFWVGSFDHHFPADRAAAGGSWFRLDGDVLTRVIEGVAVANGLAFSPDGRTLYCANTPSRSVDAFNLEPETGAVSNRRTFVILAPGDGHIDGAAVDAEGGYWLAVVGTGTVRRYLPNGSLDRTITLPCSNPTKPAFGGAALDTLYFTSAKMVIKPDAPGADANGGLFAVTPNVRGIADTLFAD